MIAAEKGCRKIRTGQPKYSPEMRVCLDCCQVYKQLIRRNLDNRSGNSANLRRKAGKIGIDNAFSLTNQELVDGYNEAKEKSSQMMA